MISAQEFGRYADLSAKVVRAMITRGQLQAAHCGREWRIPRDEAFRVLGLTDPEGQAPAPPTPPRPPLSQRGRALLERLQA